MDRRAIIFAIPAAALCCLTFACSKNGEPEGGRQAVEIEVSVDGRTLSRVTTSGNLFEEGDKFRFFFNSQAPTDATPPAPGDDASLKITDYVYSSGEWQPAAPLYWDDYKPVTREFCAVMPFSGDYTVAGHKFTVQAVQSPSDSSGYKKSDLLMARVSTDKRLIPLRFYHMMAKVVVEVKASTDAANTAAFGENAFATMTASLNNIRRTGVITFNGLTPNDADHNPAVSVSGDTGAGAGDVAMLQLTEAAHDSENAVLTMRFVALIPPQTVAEGVDLLTFGNVEGGNAKTYYMKAPGGATFAQGKSTLVTVTMDKLKVEIAEEDANIKIVEWDEIDIAPDDPIVLPN